MNTFTNSVDPDEIPIIPGAIMMYLTKIVEHRVFSRNNIRQYCLRQLSFTAVLANLQVVQHV